MAVRLYLVQHGQAKTEDEDPERSLTDQGPARVFHSGKARARQSAEIWGELLHAAIEQAGGLAPNDDPTTWLERLNAEADDILLVGHLPHLARLAGLLLIGDADHSVINFRPGGLVGLERSDQGWHASLLVPP
jgi:phosphohistidine phosphatase